MNQNQLVEAEPEPTAEVEEAAVAEDIPDWLQGLAEEELNQLSKLNRNQHRSGRSRCC